MRACLAVLEVRLDLVARWRGGSLDRLRDAGHAALAAAWKRRLERWGWQVWVEVSFNHYGERGRVDLVAWHPIHRLLLVVEVKTEIADVQALLGGLDIKRRVAPAIARGLRIASVAGAVPLLVVADGTTNRERVRRLAPLFSLFTLRGREAVQWLRRPSAAPVGMLVFTDLRFATGNSVTSVGPHRVRRRGGTPSVDAGGQPVPDGARPT